MLRRRLSRRLLVQLPVWVRRMPVRTPHPPPHPPPPVTTYVFVYILPVPTRCTLCPIAHEATAQGAFQIGSSSSPPSPVVGFIVPMPLPSARSRE